VQGKEAEVRLQLLLAFQRILYALRIAAHTAPPEGQAAKSTGGSAMPIGLM